MILFLFSLISCVLSYGMVNPVYAIGPPFVKESTETSAANYRFRDFRLLVEAEYTDSDVAMAALRDDTLGYYLASGMQPLTAVDESAKVFPLFLGTMGIDVVFNLPGVLPVNFFAQDRTGVLRLTMDVVADIFQGVITRWDDPRIAALNSGAPFPNGTGVMLPAENITFVLPTENSDVALRFTQRMEAEQPTFGYSWGIAPSALPAWPASLPRSGNFSGGDGLERVMIEVVERTPYSISFISTHSRLVSGVTYADLVLVYAGALAASYPVQVSGNFYQVQSWNPFVQTSFVNVFGQYAFEQGELGALPSFLSTQTGQVLTDPLNEIPLKFKLDAITTASSWYPLVAPISVYLREYTTEQLAQNSISCERLDLVVQFSAFGQIFPSSALDTNSNSNLGFASFGQPGGDLRARQVRRLREVRCGARRLSQRAVVGAGGGTLLLFAANLLFEKSGVLFQSVPSADNDVWSWFNVAPEAGGLGAGVAAMYRAQPLTDEDAQYHLRGDLPANQTVSIPLAAESVAVLLNFWVLPGFDLEQFLPPPEAQRSVRLTWQTLSDIITGDNGPVTYDSLIAEQDPLSPHYPALEAYFIFYAGVPVTFAEVLGRFDYKTVLVQAFRRALPGVAPWDAMNEGLNDVSGVVPSRLNERVRLARQDPQLLYLPIPNQGLQGGTVMQAPCLTVAWIGDASSFAELMPLVRLFSANGSALAADDSDAMELAVEEGLLQRTAEASGSSSFVHGDVVPFETDLTYTPNGYPLVGLNFVVLPRATAFGTGDDVITESELVQAVYLDENLRRIMRSSSLIPLPEDSRETPSPFQRFAFLQLRELSVLSNDSSSGSGGGGLLIPFANCISPITGAVCELQGRCVEDACICDAGFVGETCSQVACLGPNGVICSGQGTCINNVCICDSDSKGEFCEKDDSAASLSLAAVLAPVLSVVGCCLLLLCGLLCLALALCCALVCVVVCAGVAVALLAAVAVVVVIAAVVAVAGLGGASARMLRSKTEHFREQTEKIKMEADERARTLEELLADYEADDGLGYREILWEDLEKVEMVGQGAFGNVYRGMWLGATVAIKELQETELTDNVLDDFRREAAMMTKLGNHPHLVSFIGAVTREGQFAIVTEFCQNGSLLDLLEEEPLDLPTIVSMALGIARGLFFLHKSHVVHRDVAARNCLVDRDMVIKVSDFGASVLRMADAEAGASDEHDSGGSSGAGTPSVRSRRGTMRMEERRDRALRDTEANGHIGPVRWMAPESLVESEYSEASDVYMYAITVWEMWHRRRPYADEADVAVVARAVVNDRRRPEIDVDCPKVLAKLIRKCWVQDPAKRWTLAQVIEALEAYLDNISVETMNSSPTQSSRRGSSLYNVSRRTLGPLAKSSTVEDYQVPSTVPKAVVAEYRNTQDVPVYRKSERQPRN